MAVQAEMEKEFGNDNAYGVIGFRRLLESMGEEERYVMYQYASSIAHGHRTAASSRHIAHAVRSNLQLLMPRH